MKTHTLKIWKNPKQKFVKNFTSLNLLFDAVNIYKSNNFNVSVTIK
jgi:hypothetical protein